MGADTAQQQQTVVENRQPIAPARDAVQDFTPPKTSSWSDIASQCWNDHSSCASAVGRKLGDTFGLGSTKEQELIKQGQLPDLRLIESGGDTKTDGTAAVPKALQGDNKRRTPEIGEWKSPYERKYEVGDKFKGIASVYWQDSQTASGIRFNKNEHTAASREFPFGTVLKVRNPETGKETRVVITDHGPFAGKKEIRPDGSEKVHNRVLDLSDGAAKAIGMGRTVKQLEVSVESIPEGGRWGKSRQNLNKAGKEDLIAQVKRVTADGRT